ncbi:MAG: S8 family serine peptidase, partial [Actinomycetes bacterium]
PDVSTFVAYVAPTDLRAVAAVPGVVLVSEILAPTMSRTAETAPASRAVEATSTASTTRAACAPTASLADTQLKAAIARAGAGVNGAGIKIGVVSDSYDRDKSVAATAAQDVASGNLPGIGNPCGFTTPVQVLADNTPDANHPVDEGRAMLQLVHKVAPGATLMFATGWVGGQSGMADNIRALQAAGANVIVDDLAWDDETMFQDGIVAKAVAEVTALGTTYLSSVGNSNSIVGGRDVSSIELPAFTMTSCPAPVASEVGVPANSCLNFAPTGTSNTAWYTLAKGAGVKILMNYSEPMFGVTDDISLYLLDNSETTILASSTQSSIGPDGTGEPVQVFYYQNATGAPVTVKLAMSRVAGSGTPRTKVIVAGATGIVDAQYTTSSGSMTVGPTVFGHTGSTAVFSVAATSGLAAGTTPESFSSRGPVTHYWGPFTTLDAPASAIPPQVIAKPDFTATDRDCTTFFTRVWPDPSCPYLLLGTSAAAPNAAGVAALVLSQNPKLTPAQVGARLASTATPMSGGSVASTGAGLLNAFAALGSPLPVQAQVPVNGCVLVPKAIPRRGKR